MPELTVARLHECFTLDRIGWVFIWKQPGKRRTVGKIAGCINADGYRIIGVDGRPYMAHILIYAYIYRVFPPYEIDHKNHIRDDNNPDNLRLATHTENSRNQSMYANNTSGVVGVTWNKQSKKWKAQIKVNSKYIYLGLFTNKKHAIKARKKAERKYDFHPNHGKLKC